MITKKRGQPGDIKFSKWLPKGKFIVMDRDVYERQVFGRLLGPPEGKMLVFHSAGDYLDFWFAGEKWGPQPLTPK